MGRVANELRVPDVAGAVYSLSEKGVRPVVRKHEQLTPCGDYVPLRSERDIFDFLGCRWMEPARRFWAPPTELN